jgi:hypothetical protein
LVGAGRAIEAFGCNQSGRGIDSSKPQASGSHAGGNRLSAAATKIQDGRSGRQQTSEAINPTLVIPAGGTAIGIPCNRVTFVVGSDQVSKVAHQCAPVGLVSQNDLPQKSGQG